MVTFKANRKRKPNSNTTHIQTALAKFGSPARKIPGMSSTDADSPNARGLSLALLPPLVTPCISLIKNSYLRPPSELKSFLEGEDAGRTQNHSKEPLYGRRL
jgi:hypothetical protein